MERLPPDVQARVWRAHHTGAVLPELAALHEYREVDAPAEHALAGHDEFAALVSWVSCYATSRRESQEWLSSVEFQWAEGLGAPDRAELVAALQRRGGWRVAVNGRGRVKALLDERHRSGATRLHELTCVRVADAPPAEGGPYTAHLEDADGRRSRFCLRAYDEALPDGRVGRGRDAERTPPGPHADIPWLAYWA